MDVLRQTETVLMNFDEGKIDKAALALLYLTLHDQCRAWKGIAWEAMNRLHSLGLIENPVGKAKSVVLTSAGIDAARSAAEELFSSDQPSVG